MPLRDHFHSPVNDKHSWDVVHGGWPMEIVRQLFDLLPPRYVSGPKVHLGSPVEVDIGTHEDFSREWEDALDSGGGVATLPALAPTFTVAADLSEQDQYEVLVYDTERNRQLVAAIEIVSPSNKDRPETREVFVGKLASLLRQDVCVSVIDIVSNKQSNLYAELLARLGRTDPTLPTPPPYLYAVTLRGRKPPRRVPRLDAWFYPLTVGQPLPTLPLWLSPDEVVQLPLENGYQETCRLLRIA
jgi:hypothetical protein